MCKSILSCELEVVSIEKRLQEEELKKCYYPFSKEEEKLLELTSERLGTLLTAREIQQITGVCRSKVYRNEKFGPVRGFKTGNRKVYEHWFIIILLRKTKKTFTMKRMACNVRKLEDDIKKKNYPCDI